MKILNLKIFKSKEKIFQDKEEKLKSNSDTFNIFEKKNRYCLHTAFITLKLFLK